MGTIYKNTLYEKPVIWPKYNEKSVNHITLNGIEVYDLETYVTFSSSTLITGAGVVKHKITNTPVGGLSFEIIDGVVIMLRDVPVFTIVGSAFFNNGDGVWASSYIGCIYTKDSGDSKRYTLASYAAGGNFNLTKSFSKSFTDVKKGDKIQLYSETGSGTARAWASFRNTKLTACI